MDQNESLMRLRELSALNLTTQSQFFFGSPQDGNKMAYQRDGFIETLNCSNIDNLIDKATNYSSLKTGGSK